MAKKIQKKQIESGIFVETKDTYEAPVRDNDFVQKKYVDTKVDTKADKVHTHKWTNITEKPEIKKVDSKYTIEGLNGEIAVPTLPAWVGDTKPTYNWSEIIDKPSLNYLPLTGGMITPTEGDYREGIRIGDKDGWSLVLLGAVNASGTTENSWVVARKPDNSLQINNGGISNNKKKGLSLTANSLTFSDDTKSLLEVSNEVVHTNKMFDAPVLRVHTPGVDYVSLNSKNNKLNVKDGNGGREGNSFKPVLASGYEINGKTDNEVVLAGGGVTNLDSLKNENIKIGGRNYVLNSKERKKITPTSAGWIVGYELSINLEVGETYVLNYKNYGERMLSILWSSSNSWDNAQEISKGTPFIAKENYKILRFHTATLNKLCDFELVKLEKGNKATDWTPAPEDLATAEELMRKITRTGYDTSTSVVVPRDQQNNTIFVKASCTLGLQNIEHLGNTSFRKVFDGGSIIFTCEGKNIIYTGDNTFNGKKGSTAVVSIYNNDCYIDIRNV